jgi:hypothetical protein
MIATLALVLALQGGGEPQRAPTVSARVTPESPAVGEPITVELRVRAPRGTTVRFPVLPDTGTRIEPLDPRTVSATDAAGEVDQTATYRLIAWDTGSVNLQFGDVTLERAGSATRYPVRMGELRIRSLLPQDTAARVPKPARAPLDAPTMPWRWLVACVVMASLLWVGWRRWRRHRQERASFDPGAAVRARQGFAHVRALDLLGAGEPGRHALAHVQVLRRYLAERWPELPTSLTASEIEATLARGEFPILPDRLVAAVATSEQVAYAGAAIAADASERLAAEVTSVVEDLEKVWLVRQAKALEDSRIRRKKLR